VLHSLHCLVSSIPTTSLMKVALTCYRTKCAMSSTANTTTTAPWKPSIADGEFTSVRAIVIPPNHDSHINSDHCLNHLRQTIQCHMDLTPVRTVYFKEMNTEVGDFDQEHTCRDMTKLQQWMNEKYTALSIPSPKTTDDQVHRLGYPDNDEALRPWNYRDREFS
jgi:hypothetical protein